METTLNKIRKHAPCQSGWKKLLAHLGKTSADDEPISISFIAKSNGLDDAFWSLRAVEGSDRELRLYAVWCALQVQHLITDSRSLAALDIAEKFANGRATSEELRKARHVALDAAWYAARHDAWHDAWDAARDAAWASVWDAACDAAWGAARAAARAAARHDAWYDAGGTARVAQLKRLIEIC